MYKNEKTIKMLAVTSAVTMLMLLIPNVYAGGARWDWPESVDNIPEGPQCWSDGYDDGLENPFNRERHRECIFGDVKAYYTGFIDGCKSVEGNTEEDCDEINH
ncbi:MAG: hypothetical protein WA941_15430 [Nitrososphaeraceae archaeon]